MGNSDEEKSTKTEKPSSPVTVVSSTSLLFLCRVVAFMKKLEF
jgi:hypothetical protein